MLRLVLLLSLAMSGCASFQSNPVQDGRLAEYIEAFELEYNIEVNYSIIISDINKGNAVGICYYGGEETKIIVDRRFYELNKDKYYVMHQLMFHEMGHCSLRLAHNDVWEDFKPVSIMKSNVFGHNAYYEENLEYYLDSLIDDRAIYLNSNQGKLVN